MSISAILAKAFSTTLLGMGTVFALLIVISLIISWLRYIPAVLDRLQKPKPTAVAPAASAASDAAGGMQAASGDDRRKLAAVITAAIAAYEAQMETYIVTVDGTAYEVTVQKKSQLQPECTPQAAPAHPQTKESKIAAAPVAAVDENALKVTSGTSGKIWKVVAAAGDTVKRGDTLVILEAMKMEIPVVAPEDGQVLSINAAEGDSIETGDTVACLKPQSAGE